MVEINRDWFENSWNEDIRKKTVCFTGHRPDKLDNCYSFSHPMVADLSNVLMKRIEKLILENGIEYFISGAALGTDQIAFWCIQKIKKKYPHIKNIVAVPCADHDKKMNGELKEWYAKMIAVADDVVYVYKIEKYDRDRYNPNGQYSPYKMQLRNEYMVDRSCIVVAVWDKGNGGGTFNAVSYARKQYRTIYFYNPLEDFKEEILFGIKG